MWPMFPIGGLSRVYVFRCIITCYGAILCLPHADLVVDIDLFCFPFSVINMSRCMVGTANQHHQGHHQRSTLRVHWNGWAESFWKSHSLAWLYCWTLTCRRCQFQILVIASQHPLFMEARQLLGDGSNSFDLDSDGKEYHRIWDDDNDAPDLTSLRFCSNCNGPARTSPHEQASNAAWKVLFLISLILNICFAIVLGVWLGRSRSRLPPWPLDVYCKQIITSALMPNS